MQNLSRFGRGDDRFQWIRPQLPQHQAVLNSLRSTGPLSVRIQKRLLALRQPLAALPGMGRRRQDSHVVGRQAGNRRVTLLEFALAGATGVSGGSAQRVPAMLMPGRVWGRPLTDLVDLQRLEDAPLGKVVCFRIQGTRPGVNDPEAQERSRQEISKNSGRDPGITTQEPRTLWIDRSLFVLRRIDAASQSTTDCVPRLRRPTSRR